MIDIQVNAPIGLSDEINKKIGAAVSAAVQTAIFMTKAEWETQAKEKLKATRKDYIAGLNQRNSVEFPDPFTGVLTLRGKWPNMLEEGFPPFDMKPGFARSAKAKKTKDGGWYLNIPFRHLTPGAEGINGGQPMPHDIYAQARQLRMNIDRLTGTETKYAPRISWTGYQHQNGIYEGMVRKPLGATKSSYLTFRRVSNKSDPMAWWHSGFQGIHVESHVAQFATDTLQKAIEANINSVFK